jgi:phosphoglycolate phosphatase
MAEKLLMMFDLDGTLVNTVDSIISCANQVRILGGFPERDPFEIYSKIGLPPTEFFNDLDLDSNEISGLVSDFRNTLNQVSFNSSSLYPGTHQLLEMFRDMRIPLAVATNKPTSNAELLLEKTSIREYFVKVQGSDGLNPKPHPDILLRLAKQVGVTKAIMVGDRSEDILAAKAAGFQSIGLAQTFHSEFELKNSGAILVFTGMQEFANTFDEAYIRDIIRS